MSRSSRRSDSASAARPAARPASERRTSCCSSARPHSRSLPNVECSRAAARSANGNVTRATTPMALITRTSAVRLVPKPSSEASGDGVGTARDEPLPHAVRRTAQRGAPPGDGDRPRDRGGEDAHHGPHDVEPRLAVTRGCESAGGGRRRSGRRPGTRGGPSRRPSAGRVADARGGRRPRAIMMPRTRSGSPIRVTDRPMPAATRVTTRTNAGTANGRVVSVYALSRPSCRSQEGASMTAPSPSVLAHWLTWLMMSLRSWQCVERTSGSRQE